MTPEQYYNSKQRLKKQKNPNQHVLSFNDLTDGEMLEIKETKHSRVFTKMEVFKSNYQHDMRDIEFGYHGGKPNLQRGMNEITNFMNYFDSDVLSERDHQFLDEVSKYTYSLGLCKL